MIKYLKTEEGKEYPFSISYTALSLWQEETGKKIEQLESGLQLNEIEPLFYYALVSGHRASSKVFNIKRKSDEYSILIDDLWFKFINSIPDFFQGLQERA